MRYRSISIAICSSVVLLCSCTGEKSNRITETLDIDLEARTRARLSNLELDSARGHLIFTCEKQVCTEVIGKSMEQPEASIQWISDTQFALINLLPQQHSILLERKGQAKNESAYYSNLEIRPGEYVEAGIPPFETNGTLKGRVVAALNSTFVPNATVVIQELGFTSKTNSSGEFSFESLPVGKWHLSINAPDHGFLRNQLFTVDPEKESDAGDLWLGYGDFSVKKPELINGINNIVNEPKARIRLYLPQGSRFISIETADGDRLLSKGVARQEIEFPLPRSFNNDVVIKVFNAKSQPLGALVMPLIFDPFATDGKVYKPTVHIEKRVISSPNRVFNLTLKDRPSQATLVRVFLDGKPLEWQSSADSIAVALPKSNEMCGQRLLQVEYENAKGFRSKISETPVTLSCWERIPHRAGIERIIGIDNAAVWTGTHAFVWSGKQFDYTRRTANWGGSNSAETVNNQTALHTYQYMESGYIFRPTIDQESGQLSESQMEFIVTDNAPAARVLPGSAGLNNLVAIYGGENASGPLADGALFDISSNGWVSMNGDGAPSPRIKPSVTFLDEEKILVWGGYTRTLNGFELPLNDGAIYNSRTHQWQKISEKDTPVARLHPLTVWTGEELFVMGGILPGGVEQLSIAKYNPQTDSWHSLPNLTEPLTYASALYHDGHILIFGRNNKAMVYEISSQSFSYNETYSDIPKRNTNPNLVLAKHPDDADKRVLYIMGGGASQVETDVNEYLFSVAYTDGQFDREDPRTQFWGGMMQSATLNGVPIAKCCYDFLAFDFADHVFAINGTEVSNTTVYTDIRNSTFINGATTNFAFTFYSFKGYNSRVISYNADTKNLQTKLIDRAQFDSPGGLSSSLPYFLTRTSRPVWDSQNKNLVFYGGQYRNPVRSLYQQGGLIYNVDSRTWRTIPKASSEPTYSDVFLGEQTYSRFETIQFIFGNFLYVLGGYRYNATGNVTYLFDGLKSMFNTNSAEEPQSILSNNPSLDFTLINNTGYELRWDASSPCVGQGRVLLAGGLRKTVPDGESGETPHSAVVSDKVVFNSSTDSLHKAAPDSLGSRAGMAVVSTGEQCILWGGYSAENAIFNSDRSVMFADVREHMKFKNDGAIYSLTEDTWTSMSGLNAPPPRAFMHSVWTGKEALLWGGSSASAPGITENSRTEKGVWLFSPEQNRWTPLEGTSGEPPFNGDEYPVWTGKHMLIWKPRDAEHSYQFSPQQNKWTQLPMPYGFNYRITASWGHYTVWTGSKLFVIDGNGNSDTTALMAFFVPPDP